MEGGRGQGHCCGGALTEKAKVILSLRGVAEEKRKSRGLVEGQRTQEASSEGQ